MACTKRKAYFSDREIAKIVDLCVTHHALLTGKHGDDDGKEKNQCWVDIVESTTMNLNDAQIGVYSSNAELAREKIVLVKQRTKTEKERERFFEAAAGRIESSGLGDMYRLLTEQ